ncbi:MAG: PAS domain S-box protein, partial [Planctomycetes bacterium]|nr:PAS domain S-box protein [Planctomycetota bacterium]
DITERKDAEMALRDSAEKFRTLARSVGAYRNTGGPEGKFLEAGPAIANIFGYDSTEEFLTIHVADLYRCREDRSEFVRKMKEAGGRLDGELLPLKKKDGTPIWVSITAQAHFDENGKIEYMDGVAMDVTERIEAQKALEESEKKYKTLVENSHQDVVIFQGSPPTVVFTNSHVGRLLGYEPEEVEGWSFEKLLSHVHPDERNKIRERNKARMRGEAVPSRYELRVKTREGNWRWMEVFVSQIKYRGEPALLGVFIDIHERKMAEEALKQSEKRYRDLFEHSFSAIFVHDTDGNILHVNKRAEKMLGYTAEELESMKVADFHPENELDNSQQALEEVVEKGYTCFKIPFKKKDGTLLSAQVSASSWETDDGVLIQGIVRELGKNPCEEETDE